MTNDTTQTDHDTEVTNKIYLIGEQAIFRHNTGNANTFAIARDVVEAVAPFIMSSALRLVSENTDIWRPQGLTILIDDLDPEGITK